MRLIIYLTVFYLYFAMLFTLVAEAQQDFEIYEGSGVFNSWESHLECERHFFAAKQSVDELTAYSASQVLLVQDLSAKLNQCLPNSGSAEQKFGGGMLYKPVSDSDGKAVLVMAPRYCDASNAGMRVSLFDADNNLLESSLRFTGCANGGRPNHRAAKTGNELHRHAPIIFRWTFNEQEEHIVVKDPRVRVE